MKQPRWVRALRSRARVTTPIDWSERPPKEAWQASIDGEVRFWEDWLATKGGRWPGDYETRLDPDLPLQPELADLIQADPGTTVRLLDVGAGPLTFLGRTSDRWTLEISAVDALGEQYDTILAAAGIVAPLRTQTCESERLTNLFSADAFDLVAARNTLDHSYDPIRAIEEMVTVARPGAALVLVHHRNTAEDEKYHGMHQWNFEVANHTLTVWRPGQRSDVSAALGGTARFETSWIDGTWEHVVFRKA